MTSAASIIAAHADRAGIPVAEFLGPSKRRPIAHARQDAMAEIRSRTNLTLPQIGRAFGMHHASIIHGIRAAEARAQKQETAP